MPYYEYHVGLTDRQKAKLLSAYKKRAPITLRLKHYQLSGNDVPYENANKPNTKVESKQTWN